MSLRPSPQRGPLRVGVMGRSTRDMFRTAERRTCRCNGRSRASFGRIFGDHKQFHFFRRGRRTGRGGQCERCVPTGLLYTTTTAHLEPLADKRRVEGAPWLPPLRIIGDARRNAPLHLCLGLPL